MKADPTLQALHEALGPRGVRPGANVEERYLVEVLGARGEPPLAVPRPADTAEVSKALATCHAASLPVVTQGGRTGLAHGHRGGRCRRRHCDRAGGCRAAGAAGQVRAARVEQLRKLGDLSIEVSRQLDPIVPFDVSIAIPQMEAFVADLGAAVRAIDARCETIVFGHVGDGNLHLAVHQPPARPETFDMIEYAVYALAGKYRGSVSAEHGIGRLKREFPRHSRSAAEIAAMRALKNTFDPKHILNRGRIFE